ncbi:MAG: DNA repair protein RecO [Thermomicrobiales bacterium]|nr:DNA repair protein RecO [Thermomicrobiales bacterium]MCO5221252.1 DNA repair protein RecO [Thermomicrobiales bacterium]
MTDAAASTSEITSPATSRDRIYRTEAIVLSRFDMGETDRVFTLLTRDRGKIRAVAKGARKPTSKLAPALDYFNRCRMILSRGRDLDVITSVEVLDRRETLGERVNAFSHACHLAEVTGRFVPERQDVPEVYQLLSAALQELDRPGEPWILARWYELALLAVTGYRLDLYRCAGCGNELVAEPNMLGIQSGGVLCPNCWPLDPNGRVMSINVQKILRSIDRNGMGELSRVSIDPALAGEIEATLALYMRSIAERDFSSLKILREIRETAPYFDV